MSDVIIRGMEMPKSCYSCAYQHWSNFWQRYVCCSVLREGDPILINGKEVKSTDVLRSGRSDNCPIFEVPPHGRLGDLDRLEKRFTPVEAYYPTEEDRRDYDNGRLMIRDIRSAIKDVPTIIPASEVYE